MIEEHEQESNSEQQTSNTECPKPSEEQPEPSHQDMDVELTVESVIEAVLFASDEPLSEARLADIVETRAKQIREHIKNLNEKYEANNNAFRKLPAVTKC